MNTLESGRVDGRAVCDRPVHGDWTVPPMIPVCCCGKTIDPALVGRQVWATHGDGCPDGQVRMNETLT